MLDKYIWGEVGRISPEAPVPVVRATHQQRAAGRRGQRGHEPAQAGRADPGDRIYRRRRERKLLAEGLRANGITPQLRGLRGISHRSPSSGFWAGRQQMLRLDSERMGARPQATTTGWWQRCWRICPGCDAVVLSDYAKGVLTPEVCQAGDSGGAQAGDSGAGRSQERGFYALSRRYDHLPEPGRAGHGCAC